MTTRRPLPGLAVLALLAALPACSDSGSERPAPDRPQAATPAAPATPGLLDAVSVQGHQLTGVAVSSTGRVFVSFPRWSAGDYALGVGEALPDGTIKPFPSDEWNVFGKDPKVPPPPGPQGGRWVCVQSVHCDDRDRLWVLDPASPLMAGVVRGGGGPKLVRIDLASTRELTQKNADGTTGATTVTTPDRVIRVYPFDASAAPADSYLNDVRIDTAADTAYITDSGLGAIVVLDLKTGIARRLLADHPSTKADPKFAPTVGGKPLRFAMGPQKGQVPRIHADGIALDAKGGWLYWQALTNTRLHRAPTKLLRDPATTPEALAKAVESLGETVMADGLEFGPDGNLYITALERDAVLRRSPDGTLTPVAQGPRLAWPDSLAIGPAPAGAGSPGERWLYITTSQIHRTERFAGEGARPTEPYRVLRVKLP